MLCVTSHINDDNKICPPTLPPLRMRWYGIVWLDSTFVYGWGRDLSATQHSHRAPIGNSDGKPHGLRAILPKAFEFQQNMSKDVVDLSIKPGVVVVGVQKS